MNNGNSLALNNAAVSGGGLSVKSGKAYVSSAVTIEYNHANGAAAAGYGNGGGVFITTSVFDGSAPDGAGWGAATLYDDHGFVECLGSGLTIRYNEAARWGGGIYAGISPPWHDPPPLPTHYDRALVTIRNVTLNDNVASQAGDVSPYFPSQIAVERARNTVDGAAVLNFLNSAVRGDLTRDIGQYLRDSKTPDALATCQSVRVCTVQE